jgi:hypothetical protein
MTTLPAYVLITRPGLVILMSFGYRAHLTAAIEDFQRSVIELYLTLESQPSDLAPGLQKTWEALQRFIEPRQ